METIHELHDYFPHHGGGHDNGDHGDHVDRDRRAVTSLLGGRHAVGNLSADDEGTSIIIISSSILFVHKSTKRKKMKCISNRKKVN